MYHLSFKSVAGLGVAFLAGASLTVGSMALARPDSTSEAGPKATVIATYDIQEKVRGKQATATIFDLTFEPGASSHPHRHPGPTFGYVLVGTFEFAVGDKEVQTLKPGDTFYEPALALHRVSRNPSKNTDARVLAIIIHPRDVKDLVLPARPN